MLDCYTQKYILDHYCYKNVNFTYILLNSLFFPFNHTQILEFFQLLAYGWNCLIKEKLKYNMQIGTYTNCKYIVQWIITKQREGTFVTTTQITTSITEAPSQSLLLHSHRWPPSWLLKPYIHLPIFAYILSLYKWNNK